ncbi:hypothetical protein [Spongiactinospora sp. 9N601]|uniref:hypothetical protein n=1 Tax=Spongiactinospora sp. 9N601 TaxID=3375149 RepID=UPI0037B8C4CB
MNGSLTLFEVKRLLRNPFLLGSGAVALGWLTVQTWAIVPDWSLVTIGAATGGLIVGATALVVAHVISTRERRGGMPELLATLPAQGAARARAAMWSVGLVTTFYAGVVMVLHLVSLLPGIPAGRLDVFEVLSGLAAVLLASVGGVALGRWLPSPVAGPVAVFVVLLTTQLVDTRRYGSSLAWLLPVPGAHVQPVGLLPRSSAEHAVYLLALAALVASIAMLRDGAHWRRMGGVLAGVGVAIPIAVVSIPPDYSPRTYEKYAASAARSCRTLASVKYCALSSYEPWIPLWADAITPIVNAMPPDARGDLPEIRQQLAPPSVGGIDTFRSPPEWPRVTGPELRWGRNGAESAFRGRLAGLAVAAAFRFPAPLVPFSESERLNSVLLKASLTGSDGRVCDARGQGRTIVALWLVMQVSEPGTATLGGAYYGRQELDYARRLDQAPRARERVHRHWNTLLLPETTVEQAASLLGLPEASDPPMRSARPCG